MAQGTRKKTASMVLFTVALTLAAYAPGGRAHADHAKHRSPVGAICEARCDQEARCENIGPGEKYETRGECDEKFKDKLQPDLNAYECPKGYDQAQLDKCLNEIRSEDCMSPFDTLQRMVTCRSGDICKG